MSDLPKEQQSAYQRWEMTSFDDERQGELAARAARQAEQLAAAAAPAPNYPSPETLAAIREQARAEGYDEGHAAGHADGHSAGHADGLALGMAAAAVELAQLKSVALAFAGALAEAGQLIANDVLDLALQLAKGMLKTALPVRPELILPVVREAIEYLPVLQQPALLMLNPADAQVVRDGIGEALDKGGWRLIEDPHVGRGGCKVDTASNQIDAQAATRWQRLTNALGKDLDWLAP